MVSTPIWLVAVGLTGIHLGIRTLNARLKGVFNRLGSGETFLIKEATLAIKQE